MDRNRRPNRPRRVVVKKRYSGNKPIRYHRHSDQLSRKLNPKHIDAIRIQISQSLEEPVQIYERSVRNLQQDLQLFKLEDDRRSTYERFFKRSIDVAGALAGLILLSPLFLLIAILIRWTSPGPVIFSQERVGKGGEFFKIYKFRTMVPNAELLKKYLQEKNEMGGPAFKMKDDPRVTPVGRILRKYSLDELPQLYNILMGDMSIVGPRPALPDEVLSWRMWQTRRLSVDQGLTCIWQISGRNQITFDRWMELDLEYIDNWNLWLDMKIIFRTVLVVITGKGAY
ncbi:MAG: sugar transferase [Oligoflexus sp.]